MAELSIAIADDNRQTLNLLGEILEKEDWIHVVGKVDNGEDAYNMIVRTNPDIVLADGSCRDLTEFPCHGKDKE